MKSPKSQHQLLEAEKVLSSLMELIPKVLAFKGKWAVIITKLTNLPTHLAGLSELSNFSSSTSLVSELVHSVVQTLLDTSALATKCMNPSPSDGKLRTQSDLDSVSARLDHHIKDLGIFMNSLALRKEGNAVDGRSESVSSIMDSVRVEASNLLMTRLQIGNFESRDSAMDSLLGYLYEDDKSVLTAVAEGFVPVLVNLLDSSSVEIKEKAVSAISRVSTVDGANHVLLAEGPLLITHLLRVLDSRNGFAREKACIALKALSFSEENARMIGCSGGIASLLEICQAGSTYAQAYAVGVLRNISVFSEIKQYFIEENAIPVLIAIGTSGTLVAQENAIGCLSNLVSEDESLKLVVSKEGGIQCLKSFWDGAPTIQSIEVSIELLKNLASCRSIGEALVSEGFLAKLVGVLSCGVASVRLAAAGAICELSFSSKARKEVGEVGVIPPLIGMLEAKSSEEKEMAAQALAILMLYAGNRKLFLKEDKALECTVQLLGPSIINFDKKYLISVLNSIVNSSKCRKEIVDSGAFDHLPKLIDMEVDGAKKLNESLHRNNSWSVFARRR
ncbi:uncharacterized protein LOC133823831 [Humulus lupulus]|uniref:uncharacterized protein LOC133823831 n=1 Tax=Humulus lupulus TaxID=3486 RepID=UPI002B401BD6|nr:uncharacterized protein LOC133823831 [Humulus lupulus]